MALEQARLVELRQGLDSLAGSIHAAAETLPGPYLELFASRTGSGWAVFGNDVETIDQG